MSGKTPRDEDEFVFRIPELQLARLRQWMLEIDTKFAKRQVETGECLPGKLNSKKIPRIRESIERGKPSPYYGAIGGAYEYSFVPTSLGDVIKVKHVITGDIIDLSEYEDW